MKDTDNKVRAVIRRNNKILCFRANSNNTQYDSNKFFYQEDILSMMNLHMKLLFEN